MKNEELYIDLIKKVLIDYVDLINDGEHDKINGEGLWPSDKAKTMIGLIGLNNIEYCINNIIKDGIEGDFLEAGVWRGGASIFMAALAKVYNVNKKIIVADSFDGFPNKIEYKQDENNLAWNSNSFDKLKVSLETVKDNFKKFNLLDKNILFLKGYFKDSLNTPEIKKLSLLRLDGDMYSSTIETLQYLYPKLEHGGYIIIDDYNALKCAREAAHDYRKQNDIKEKIITVGWSCAYWRKGYNIEENDSIFKFNYTKENNKFYLSTLEKLEVVITFFDNNDIIYSTKSFFNNSTMWYSLNKNVHDFNNLKLEIKTIDGSVIMKKNIIFE